ncbi:MAG: site-specific integrase [Sphingobacteriales bacterium JAD_PAG50586_3]|nr:MAG: site-specific integrase [Sphingobacteriales bacterium JAD_PAG50586_3]
MASVKIILKTEKQNKAGEAPLYLRIINGRKAQYISLGFAIKPEHWDDTKQIAKKSHPNSTRFNNFLANKVAEAQGVILDISTSKEIISAKKIKQNILGRVDESFIMYAENYKAQLESTGTYLSYKRVKAILGKLKKYLDGKDLHFSDITQTWLKGYEAYLKGTLKNAVNTIYTDFKTIRRIYNEAIKDDIIPFEKSPFLRFKPKAEATKREFLTEDELIAFEKLDLPPTSVLSLHRNMYVFAAYAGGIRISDLLQLRIKDFDGEKLYLKTQKTGTIISIKLPKKAIEIISLYTPDKTHNDFIFPCLKFSGAENIGNKQLTQAISSNNAYINKNLKTIGKLAEIEKTIYFHSSRHT